MPLARTFLGLVTLAGAATPAFAQLPAVWPAPKGPNRIVYPVPPWILSGARTGPLPAVPGAPPQVAPPEVSEIRFAAPGTILTVIPDVPAAPPVAPAPRPTSPVVPAAGVAPAVPATARPAPPAMSAAGATTVTPPTVRPAAPPTVTRPDVWGPQSPRTLPGTVVPVPKGR